MHVLFLPSWYPATQNDVGGVFFRDQALSLLQYGYRVGVIAPKMLSIRNFLRDRNPQNPPFFEMDCELPTYRKQVLAALPRIPNGNYWLFRRAAQSLYLSYVRSYGRPDIIHAHSAIFGGAAAMDLAKSNDIPFVITEHSTAFARSVYTRWQMDLAGRVFNNSDGCIAVSPALRSLLGNLFPASKGRWEWVPNVVAKRFSTQRLPMDPSRPLRFLNLALMTPKKGQLDLLEAFRGVLQRGVVAELWLAGDGPSRATLEQRAKDLRISDKVIFRGLVPPEEVPKLLRDTDVMVVSSHYETFGVVAAEALMVGVPVVATRCGGPECIVTDGDGVLVPPQQPKALEEAMFDVATNFASYDGEEIARRAESRFSGAAVASRLADVYSRVLEGRRSGHSVGMAM